MNFKFIFMAFAVIIMYCTMHVNAKSLREYCEEGNVTSFLI